MSLGNSGKNKEEEEKEEGPFLRMYLLGQARPVLAQFVVWASHAGLLICHEAKRRKVGPENNGLKGIRYGGSS